MATQLGPLVEALAALDDNNPGLLIAAHAAEVASDTLSLALQQAGLSDVVMAAAASYPSDPESQSLAEAEIFVVVMVSAYERMRRAK